MANPYALPPSPLAKPRCEELESRDCPTLFAVYLFTPGVGMTGDTAATISGSLAVDPTLATDANGATLVEASSIQDALDRSIIGTVTVRHAGETLTYSMGVGQSGVHAAAHKAFRVGAGAIELEDMTRSANGSDFDYNDHYWATNVSEVSPPSLNPPSPPPPTSPPPPGGGPTHVWMTNGAGTTETGPANGWVLVNRSNTSGSLTVYFELDYNGGGPLATANLDYEILGNGLWVTFAAGASQVPIFIHPLIDTLVEPMEIVGMRLSAGSGYIVYSPNIAYIEIGDVKLNFDLDVDADGVLSDGDDRAENYLPGYKGNKAMLTTTPDAANATFNNSVFAPQRMKLVLENIGTDSLDVTAVVFEILTTTSISGYTSNRSDASIVGVGKEKDYSFRANGDAVYDLHVVNRASFEEQAYGGPYGGKMEKNRTWVNFYSKDYGGAAVVRATIFVKDGATDKPQASVLLKIPKDVDGDDLADKWEVEMGTRWTTQYGLDPWTKEVALTKFVPTVTVNNIPVGVDNEPKDPDKEGVTAAGPLVPQAEEGDAHTILEEYRGYILDGGGLNGFGGGHPGGHIRLDPARKEILVEVDRAAVINNLPGPGNDTDAKLKTILNGASGVFSNATRGAGIYMYWLMDEVALDLPKAKLDTPTKLLDELQASRDTAAERAAQDKLTLTTDFLHFIFADEIPLANHVGGVSVFSNLKLSRRGSFISVSDLKRFYLAYPLIYRSFDEMLITTAAHEITHVLYDRITVPFNVRQHTTADEADLMYEPSTRANNELATVKITAAVQGVLKVKTNRALVL